MTDGPAPGLFQATSMAASQVPRPSEATTNDVAARSQLRADTAFLAVADFIVSPMSKVSVRETEVGAWSLQGLLTDVPGMPIT